MNCSKVTKDIYDYLKLHDDVKEHIKSVNDSLDYLTHFVSTASLYELLKTGLVYQSLVRIRVRIINYLKLVEIYDPCYNPRSILIGNKYPPKSDEAQKEDKIRQIYNIYDKLDSNYHRYKYCYRELLDFLSEDVINSIYKLRQMFEYKSVDGYDIYRLNIGGLIERVRRKFVEYVVYFDNLFDIMIKITIDDSNARNIYRLDQIFSKYNNEFKTLLDTNAIYPTIIDFI